MASCLVIEPKNVLIWQPLGIMFNGLTPSDSINRIVSCVSDYCCCEVTPAKV